MPNLIPQDIREWMRRVESKLNEFNRRASDLVPGDIADGVSLNDFRSTGRFRRRSIVGTTTALGYPQAGASGTLEVYWDPAYTQVHQIFFGRSESIWTRWSADNGATWTAWTGDTGWVNITSWNAGVTPGAGTFTPQVLRQGHFIALRGRCATAGISGSVTFGTLPAGFAPISAFELGPGTITTGHTSRFFVTETGTLNAQGWTSGATLALSGTYAA